MKARVTALGVVLIAGAAALASSAPAQAGGHRFGFGYHRFDAAADLGDLDSIDDSGSSTVYSYQYVPGGLLRWEVDLEYFPDGYGGSTEKAWAPQVYVLAGRVFYAGVGVGITQSDGGFPNGDDYSDPWYAARVGIEILLLPKIRLDINANYRANSFSALDEADSDSTTLGASLRFGF